MNLANNFESDVQLFLLNIIFLDIYIAVLYFLGFCAIYHTVAIVRKIMRFPNLINK